MKDRMCVCFAKGFICIKVMKDENVCAMLTKRVFIYIFIDLRVIKMYIFSGIITKALVMKQK